MSSPEPDIADSAPVARLPLKQQVALGAVGLGIGGALAGLHLIVASRPADRVSEALALVAQSQPDPMFSSVEACPAPDGDTALVTGYFLSSGPDGASRGSLRFKVAFPDGKPPEVEYSPATDAWFSQYDTMAANPALSTCYERANAATASLLDDRIAATRAELDSFDRQLQARMGSP